MRYLPIALTIACLISPAYSQTPSAKLEAAKKQTAIALRAVAKPEDFGLMAQLGDYESARKLASRAPAHMRGSLSYFIVQDAIQKNKLAFAEREIKSLKHGDNSSRSWLELSKRYSELKRPADAKRTAFYAVSQLQHGNEPYLWKNVAVRLCEINERPAARRLFTIAAKKFLDPDPLMGAPTNALAEVAAECGFDDIALKYAGAFTDFTLIPTYALKNRDGMARRIIDHSLKEMKTVASQMKIAGKPVNKEEEALSLNLYHVYLLTLLGKNQFLRGDLKATATTLGEADTLLGPPVNDPRWLEMKLNLLMECEETAQWELADKIDQIVQELLETIPPPTVQDPKKGYKPLLPLKDRYPQARLSSLELLFQNPDKLDANERATTLNRVRPRLKQYLSEYPTKRLNIILVLARAERIGGDTNWRNTLRSAQIEALKNKRWGYLKSVAQEWQQGGESKVAHTLGLQALALWKKTPPPTSPAKNKNQLASRQIPVSIDRLQFAELLIECNLPSEALGYLFPIPKDTGWYWESTVSQYVGKYPAAPPRQLLQLAPAERRIALIIWANGFFPKRDNLEEMMSNLPGMTHPLLRPLFSRPR